MGLPAKPKAAKPSLMWFFVSLGVLLLASSFVPSFHSKTKQFITGGRVSSDVPKDRRHSGTPAAPSPKPSPTPPAKPATPPTPKPSTPPTPAPPHR